MESDNALAHLAVRVHVQVWKNSCTCSIAQTFSPSDGWNSRCLLKNWLGETAGHNCSAGPWIGKFMHCPRCRTHKVQETTVILSLYSRRNSSSIGSVVEGTNVPLRCLQLSCITEVVVVFWAHKCQAGGACPSMTVVQFRGQIKFSKQLTSVPSLEWKQASTSFDPSCPSSPIKALVEVHMLQPCLTSAETGWLNVPDLSLASCKGPTGTA